MPLDVIRAQPHLYLGSRLKRLAERMQADVIKLSERAGLPLQPGQCPLLATLGQAGPLTIGDLTEALGISQPAVTRLAARLAEIGYVTIERRGRDQRHKTVALTQEGSAALARARQVFMPEVEAAVHDILRGLPADFLDAVTELENRLETVPLSRRVPQPLPDLVIRDFTDDLAPDFRRINAEWISAMYKLEQTDIDVLENPRARIIDQGGAILFVESPSLGIIGACALQKTGDRQYELTKMGVSASARGCKAGEFLLRAAIERATLLGAKRLYLLSNRKSAAAIHLYEKLGFVHDTGIMTEFGGRYGRCDVAMLYAPAPQ
jgi:DNA-binding MarR family transcriptional regulator/N-acetylglutamate synthase-like GNAT family acetyltransferase